MSSLQTIFLLGATGHLGSQFLVSLANEPSIGPFHVVAFIRNPTAAIEAKLKNIYSHISFVKGSLDDVAEIEEQARKASCVINCASSDHLASVKAILTGLEKQSASSSRKTSIYIHVSGLGILSDNARGELPPSEGIKRRSDIGFTLEDCPLGNPHLHCDNVIAAAGTRKENPVRTLILFPGLFYGIGDGIRRTSASLRFFTNIALRVGFAGTWGRGYNSFGSLHVKDVANALLTIFKAALNGTADEGAEGFYFAIAEDAIQLRELTSRIGDILFENGLVAKGGSYPLPAEITEADGAAGWALLGGNMFATAERLKRFGWEARETAQNRSLWEYLPDEMDIILKDMGKV